MSEDWQDAAFSSRHMHNHGGTLQSKRSSTFDVRKTFGSYQIQCAAWQRLATTVGASSSADKGAVLELYRLTENGEAVVGQLSLPAALEAAVVLAASRESLRRTVEALEEEENEEDEDEDEEEEEEEEEDSLPSSPPPTRFETFSKNSFRSPKFWLAWNGRPTPQPPRPQSPKRVRTKKASANDSHVVVQTGLGYVVFAGHTCRRFKATLSCDLLGWKDVAMTGYKMAARSESDVAVVWGPGVPL
ncbi:hypothetical protein ACEQ8H_004760 [Pleosporales sp. CAS-2024a]